MQYLYRVEYTEGWLWAVEGNLIAAVHYILPRLYLEDPILL